MDKNLFNCQNPGIRRNSLCCSLLLWTSFYFPRINQQSRVGMVSANNIKVHVRNIPWQDSQTFFCPILSSYFIKLTKAATGGVLQKKLFSKMPQYSQEIICVGVFFQKVANFQAYNFIKKRIQTGVLLLRIFFKTPILKNICTRLLLNWLYEVMA